MVLLCKKGYTVIDYNLNPDARWDLLEQFDKRLRWLKRERFSKSGFIRINILAQRKILKNTYRG